MARCEPRCDGGHSTEKLCPFPDRRPPSLRGAGQPHMKPSRFALNAVTGDCNKSRGSALADRPLALTGITAFGFASAYLQQFVFPAVPLTPWGDQVMWLQDGIRILGGQIPYRDYFQLTTPGSDLFYAALLRIFGVRAWIPDLTMALLAAGVALLITLISKRLLDGIAAFAPALLFIGFTLPGSLYATHHWFSTLGILAAVLALMDRVDARRAALAGLLCGIAGCFTQTKAALAAVAIVAFLLLASRDSLDFQRRVWRECAAFCAAFAAVLLAVNAYFIRAADLSNFLFWTVIFPVRYFSAAKPFNTLRVYGMDFGRDMGVLHIAGFLFVHAVVPLIFIAFFARLIGSQRKHSVADRFDGICDVPGHRSGAFAAADFYGVATRADPFHAHGEGISVGAIRSRDICHCGSSGSGRRSVPVPNSLARVSGDPHGTRRRSRPRSL
jgi:hypothetical protein